MSTLLSMKTNGTHDAVLITQTSVSNLLSFSKTLLAEDWSREMESERNKWCFQGNRSLNAASEFTVRGVVNALMNNLDRDDQRPVVPLGSGDPSKFPSFRPAPAAEDAVVHALKSANYNFKAPTFGLPEGRRAVAEYISADLPYNLSPEDVYLTVGGKHAIEVIVSFLARRPGAHVLVSKPGYPLYESLAGVVKLEVRHFDLIPEKGWEVDLQSVEEVADENTVAMVVVNPSNPCGNVFTYQHLKKIAEMARKLGIFVIADEVYDHLTFGSNKLVRMGEFGSIVPVITLGSLSKRWVVPGWKLGWIAVCDPDGILKETGIVQSIESYLNISVSPATFLQAALPEILQKTKEDFLSKIVDLIGRAAEMCYEHIQELPCITCPHKPEGSMFVMVKLDLTLLEGITDDFDFCLKLAREESVIILPGVTFGLKNWLRLTFALELETLEQGLVRIKSFCQRHAKEL